MPPLPRRPHIIIRPQPARPTFQYYYLDAANNPIGTNDSKEALANWRNDYGELIRTELPSGTIILTSFFGVPIGFTSTHIPYLFRASVIRNVIENDTRAISLVRKSKTFGEAANVHNLLVEHFMASGTKDVMHNKPIATTEPEVLFYYEKPVIKEFEFANALSLKFAANQKQFEDILQAAILPGGLAVYPFYAQVAFAGERFWLQVIKQGNGTGVYVGRVANILKLTPKHSIQFGDYVHFRINNIIQLQ